MELRHLKYFLTVAKELSYIKAADKLHISQPPLSRQIIELENELGVKLFERNNKRVKLTNAGAYFRKEVQQMFINLEKIKIQTQKIHNNVSGEFRIAYISSTYSLSVTSLIKHLSSLYPFVHFKLYEVPTVKQIAALEQGKVDMGILRAPVLSAKINTKVWFKDGFSLVYNSALLQINSEQEIENLANETFIFFNKEYAEEYYYSLIEICAKYGFAPQVVHEANNVNSIIQLIKNGLGISILPSSIAKQHQQENISFLPLQQIDLSTEVLLANPRGLKNEITEKAMQFLLKKMEE